MNRPAGRARAQVLVGLLFIAAIAGGVLFALAPAKNQGYAPVQPIPFSHKRHAGDFKIPCMYCHVSVEKSRHATVPAVNVCMNCHTFVKTQSPYIKYVQEHYEKGEPIPWIKVHDLPSFTYFNHRRHIAAGVQCQKCHGEIQNYERVMQFAPMTMGWCVNCHRQPENNAPVTCNTCHR